MRDFFAAGEQSGTASIGMHGRAALRHSPQPLTLNAVSPSILAPPSRLLHPGSSIPARWRFIQSFCRGGGAKQIRAIARLAIISSSLLCSLLLATVNPAAAQVATLNQLGAADGAQSLAPQSSAQGGGRGGGSGGQSGSGLDVICNQLIAGTFCSPGGSGSGGYGSWSAGTSANDPSLPPCASGMPATELCN